jgi:hypothetical protein
MPRSGSDFNLHPEDTLFVVPKKSHGTINQWAKGLGRGNNQVGNLFAEKNSGNQQKNGFINKHRQIISAKDGIGNTASDNSRHTKEYQNTQFSTDAHPRFPPPSLAIT